MSDPPGRRGVGGEKRRGAGRGQAVLPAVRPSGPGGRLWSCWRPGGGRRGLLPGGAQGPGNPVGGPRRRPGQGQAVLPAVRPSPLGAGGARRSCSRRGSPPAGQGARLAGTEKGASALRLPGGRGIPKDRRRRGEGPPGATVGVGWCQVRSGALKVCGRASPGELNWTAS